MVKCSVLGCRNNTNDEYPGVTFHRFPRCSKRTEKWLQAIQRPNYKPPQSSRICSMHFKEDDINRTLNRVRLVDDACPDLQIPVTSIKKHSRKEFVVPSMCISKGNERFLEIPVLTTVEVHHPEPPNAAATLDSASEDSVSVKSEIEIEEDQEEEDEEEEDEEVEERLNATIEVPRPFLLPKQETNADFLEESPMDAADPTENEPPPPVPKPQPIYRHTKPMDQRQRITFLQRKVKVLEQRLRRKNTRHNNLKNLVKAVRVYTKSSEIENILSGNFRKLCAAYNNNGVCVNYSDEVIKFAITVHYYSPKAYEFIRKFMSLPTERMLQKYTSTGTYIINIDE